MSKLKIDIPKGHKAIFDEATGEITFVELPKNVMERIKTFEDVLKALEKSEAVFNEYTAELSEDEKAYIQIKMIAEVLNEGWTPDWENGKWDKYYPYFEMGSASGSSFSCNDYGNQSAISTAGSRLCFKSAELAKYAGTQFIEIYKKFLTLN